MSLEFPNGVRQQLTLSVFLRWERRLLEDDVCALIRFRKEKYPDVDEYFRGLDFLSAQPIVHGLVGFWSELICDGHDDSNTQTRCLPVIVSAKGMTYML